MEKKEYVQPQVESEEIFEQTALSCGSLIALGDAKDGGDCDHTMS